jgi:hypothetical protein
MSDIGPEFGGDARDMGRESNQGRSEQTTQIVFSEMLTINVGSVRF